MFSAPGHQVSLAEVHEISGICRAVNECRITRKDEAPVNVVGRPQSAYILLQETEPTWYGLGDF